LFVFFERRKTKREHTAGKLKNAMPIIDRQAVTIRPVPRNFQIKILAFD